jgi:hypothetical protein
LHNSKNSLPHTFSKFNVETLHNSKNSLSHTLNLKTWRTLFHTWELMTF